MANIDRWRGSNNLPSRSSFRDPFSRLQNEVNELFQNYFGRSMDVWGDEAGGAEMSRLGQFSPSVNIEEKGDMIRVTAELPGLKREDVDVQLERNHLTIEGDKREEKESEEGGVYRAERSFGHFRRTIPLPAEVEAEKCQAKFKDGVLEVTLPRRESADRRHIDVK